MIPASDQDLAADLQSGDDSLRMDSVQGVVSNCQHTIKVSGSANNTSTSTAYITLFRVNGRAVEFRTSSPSSISDGDQIVAAGLTHGPALDALACRNVTTGEVANSGVWINVFGAVLVAAVGTVVSVVAGSFFGSLGAGVAALLALAAVAYAIHRAVLTSRAIKMVSAH